MTDKAGTFPLLCRSDQAVVFRTRGGSVTAAAFLDAVYRAADALPDAAFTINACQHRLCFAIALAAAMLRGQVTLLSSDRSPERLRALSNEYPHLYLLTDEPASALPIRQHVVSPDPLRADAAPRPVPILPAVTTAAIVFTSGSTGRPVAHRKSWGALVERSVDAATCFGLTDTGQPHNIVGMVPAQHMYGFETTVLLPLHTATATWCDAVFYPQDVAAALRTVPEPRILVTTPLQIGALLRASVHLPPLQGIISATAPLFPEVAAAAESRWNAPVYEIFGATEVGSIASRRTVATDMWQTYPSVRLQGGSDASDLVHIVAPFTEPYPLSDLIEWQDATHFRLLGRRADVIKLGGRRASLAELNRILTGIEGVVDGHFVAPDDPERDPNARMLVFAVAPQREAADILMELRRRVDPLFLPRRVILVDRLPRNEVGKLTDEALDQLRAERPDL